MSAFNICTKFAYKPFHRIFYNVVSSIHLRTTPSFRLNSLGYISFDHISHIISIIFYMLTIIKIFRCRQLFFNTIRNILYYYYS